MVHLLIGGLAAVGLFLLTTFLRAREVRLKWWHWGLTLLGLAYVVFVLEMIAASLFYGASQASGYGRQVQAADFWKMDGLASITARERM